MRRTARRRSRRSPSPRRAAAAGRSRWRWRGSPASPALARGGVDCAAVDALRADLRRLRGRLVMGDGTGVGAAAAAGGAAAAASVVAAAPAAEGGRRRGVGLRPLAAAADNRRGGGGWGGHAGGDYVTPLHRVGGMGDAPERRVYDCVVLWEDVDGVGAVGQEGVPNLPDPRGSAAAGPTPLQLTALPGGASGCGGGLGTVCDGGGKDLPTGDASGADARASFRGVGVGPPIRAARPTARPADCEPANGRRCWAVCVGTRSCAGQEIWAAGPTPTTPRWGWSEAK